MKKLVIFLIILTFCLFACNKRENQQINEEDLLKTAQKVSLKTPITKIDDDLVVDGYMNKFAFGLSEAAQLFVNAKIKKNRANLGIYDINGSLVDNVIINIYPQTANPTNGWETGFGYKSQGNYIISLTLRSGIYFLANKLPFIVKNTSLIKSNILIVYPSNTDIAYNTQGGKSLYYPSDAQRAKTLTTLRPWVLEQSFARPFYQWLLTSTAYNCDFISDMEMDDYNNIKGYKLIIIPGHSEYWTRAARLNFDQFIATNKDALLLTGNTMWWQVRYNDTKTSMICYKYDALSNDPISDPLLKTGNWDWTQLQYPILPSIGANFKYGGRMWPESGSFGGFKVTHPNSPLYRGTNLAFGTLLKYSCHEIDGSPVVYQIDPTYNVSIPEFDNSAGTFYKAEVVAYERAVPDGNASAGAVNTAVYSLVQRTSTSGRIINLQSTNWCKNAFTVTATSPYAKTITKNAIDLLLNKENIFTY